MDFDESEVMMNHKVVGQDKAPYPVTVEVRPEGTYEWIKNYTYPKDALTSLEVRLSVPPELEQRDVQVCLLFVCCRCCGCRSNTSWSAFVFQKAHSFMNVCIHSLFVVCCGNK